MSLSYVDRQALSVLAPTIEVPIAKLVLAVPPGTVTLAGTVAAAGLLLESGTDLRVIQVLLGHDNIQTTTRYARVSAALVSKAKSPLDRLPKTG